MSTIRQLVALNVGGPLQLSTAPVPQPGPGEVSVRPRAVSLNPVDYKNLAFAAAMRWWPHVLGIEGAGIVEAVGRGVSSLEPGDEVVALVETIVSEGVFREVFVAPEKAVFKKPAALSFEEATSLPIGFLTAAATINIGLKVPLPGLTVTDTGATQPQSILILGGSSNVGAAAVQLLRLALPTATIITTSSSEHHVKLTLLGATATLERNAQQNAAAVRAVSPGGTGIDALIDAVGAASESPAVLAAFRDDGPKLYTVVRNRMDEKLPEGFQTSLVGGHILLDKEPRAMQYLHDLLEAGKYQVPLKVDVVGEGLEAIEQNLDRVPHVSGTKLVVRL